MIILFDEMATPATAKAIKKPVAHRIGPLHEGNGKRNPAARQQTETAKQ